MLLVEEHFIVVPVSNHFNDRSVGGSLEGLKSSFESVRSTMRNEFAEVRGAFDRINRRLDRHEELLGEILEEVRKLKPT